MFHEKIKELRKQKGVTGEFVATMVGLSESAYRNYERGVREPNFETLSKIADFYGVTTDYLLGRPKAKPPADPVDEFVSKAQMKSNEQAALKKWLKLDEKERKSVLDIMAKVIHEYESELNDETEDTSKNTETVSNKEIVKSEQSRKKNLSYDKYTAEELEDMMKADENAQKGAG